MCSLHSRTFRPLLISCRLACCPAACFRRICRLLLAFRFSVPLLSAAVYSLRFSRFHLLREVCAVIAGINTRCLVFVHIRKAVFTEIENPCVSVGVVLRWNSLVNAVLCVLHDCGFFCNQEVKRVASVCVYLVVCRNVCGSWYCNFRKRIRRGGCSRSASCVVSLARINGCVGCRFELC